MSRKMMLIIALTCVASLETRASAADMAVDGTVELTATAVNIGLGYRWGSGILKYQGTEYPFTIDGLSVGAVGASRASVAGDVLGLEKLEDFNGVYRGVGIHTTIIGEGGGSELKNEKGVVVRLSRTSAGLELQIGGDGVKAALKDGPLSATK